MKTLLMLALLALAPTCFGQTPRDLRAFVLPLETEDVVSASVNSDYLVGTQSLLLYRLRNGDELGRQVPAVWISKKGWKWKTCVISEDFLLESVVSRVDVKDGKIEVEFSRAGRTKTASLTPFPNAELRVVFVKGLGVEMQE